VKDAWLPGREAKRWEPGVREKARDNEDIWNLRRFDRLAEDPGPVR
jgi:hypothetical protein